MINAKATNAYSFERELKDSTGWSTIDLNIKKMQMKIQIQ